jgi:hypothetical protein
MLTANELALEGLNLLIEPSPEDQKEIDRLTKLCKHSHVALDADDPDPDGDAARLQMIASELHTLEKQRNERQAALAERYYAKRSTEMNKNRL